MGNSFHTTPMYDSRHCSVKNKCICSLEVLVESSPPAQVHIFARSPLTIFQFKSVEKYICL